jgi:hypothetical protein
MLFCFTSRSMAIVCLQEASSARTVHGTKQSCDHSLLQHENPAMDLAGAPLCRNTCCCHAVVMLCYVMLCMLCCVVAAERYMEVDIDVTTCRTAGFIVQVRMDPMCTLTYAVCPVFIANPGSVRHVTDHCSCMSLAFSLKVPEVGAWLQAHGCCKREVVAPLLRSPVVCFWVNVKLTNR